MKHNQRMNRRSTRLKNKPRKYLQEDALADAVWENKTTPLWSTALEEANERVEKITNAKKPRRVPVLPLDPISKGRRHVLFLNPGTTLIHEATLALSRGQARPAWCMYVKDLTVKNGVLHHEGLPFATSEQKRNAIKRLYFTPDKPATIQPITDALRSQYCNISRTNVRNVLRSLETYQRNFPRRRPAKVTNHTLFKQPGVLACDVFMPSKNLGYYGNRVCLTVMDVWSRFSRVYVVENKSAKLVKQGIERFVKEFVSLGHLPRRMMADKGTDLGGWKNVDSIMEQYRLPRDGDSPMVLRSVTGMPVAIVEAMNAQYQRRMQVFRTSKLIDDPADVLWAISEQLNNQRRPVRGNMTPLQLLSLSDKQRQVVNLTYKEDFIKHVPGLKRLDVGDTVRILEMTRKDQLKFQKQFAPKWSKRKYTVIRVTGLRRNPGVYKYSIGQAQTYYRHELLKIPRKTDSHVPEVPGLRDFHLIAESPI